MTDLEKALRLADIADEITMRHFRSVNLVVTQKPDKTPVSAADLETEKALNAIVAEEYGDGYRGEEGADTSSDSDRQWIVDPIDATRNFIRGMPIWGTLICLSDAQGYKVAVVTAPALGRRWWAERGKGAWTWDVDGKIRQIAVSKVGKIDDAFLLHATIFSWDKVPTGTGPVLELLRSAWRHRGVGDFLNYMYVAEGVADACFESDPKEWDLAAPSLILTEAGGTLCTSAAPGASPEDPRIAIGSNGLLEAKLKKALIGSA